MSTACKHFSRTAQEIRKVPIIRSALPPILKDSYELLKIVANSFFLATVRVL